MIILFQQDCEAEARFTGDLGPTQSVFIGIDFFVETIPNRLAFQMFDFFHDRIMV